ncbi:cytochrome P450 [Nocardia asteroides]|uniref:Cytochrome P450 n=1 Tax=Nocardia asteroides NBRC 15531 TaxID=1110697 RepID=U5E7V0_NOCAS|nr:putative cytochrome P450 [Nocardia asteroides NBRC 15531]SFM94207.1 Cytochrome P450 [Nocardia asteroides]VEG34837.1 Cytochrome P450 107B1 [Nocardia asteroides]
MPLDVPLDLEPTRCPVSPDSRDGQERVPLYSEQFAADPQSAYRDMRHRYGSLVPVDLVPGVPATLVIGYRTAVQILNDPDHFPADPRMWQRDIPADCPVLPMMCYRPNAIRTSGTEHMRYRQVTVAGLAGVDLYRLHRTVEQIAMPVINGFCTDGTADLLSQYAFPVIFATINAMLGVPDEIGGRVATGMAQMFEGGDTAVRGAQMLETALYDLVALKRQAPGDDVTTRLVQHPQQLGDEELMNQLLTMYGAGIEPTLNLILNTVRLMLTDHRFAGSLLGGSLSTRDALDEVLYTDPPMANFCTTYPRQPILVDDVWLPANQPVLISMAACNNDPTIGSGDFLDNRAHLAWSTGPHGCPAKSPAYLIAQEVIDQLLDALPELELAVPEAELVWRPGPFHRALAALPVRFPKTPPLAMPTR